MIYRADAMVYYNENDAFAAAWLRRLIERGLIAPGHVDERSIVDVQPSDLDGYTQHHFFAGIGGWSYALRLAGWPDDRPICTGSCPCQPFSSAGKGEGVEDERHLWPAFRWLIAQRRFPKIAGEQVASADGRGWLDGVRVDLEAMGYAVGAADLCAAGVAAPHIRQRLYWLADAECERARPGAAGEQGGTGRGRRGPANGRGLVQPECARLEGHAGHGADGDESGRLDPRAGGPVAQAGGAGGMGDAAERGLEGSGDAKRFDGASRSDRSLQSAGADPGDFWSDYSIVWCDERRFGRGIIVRRVEPGTFPLAARVPARVGRLRGYGNAIVPQVAATVLRAWIDTAPESLRAPSCSSSLGGDLAEVSA